MRLNTFVSRMPKLTGTDADQVLTAFYENATGIFNHQDRARLKGRPLAAVALHEAEENTTTSALYESIDIYIDNDVYTHTGMSLTEFFSLPREFFNKILMTCSKKAAKASKDAATVTKQAEAAFSAPKP